MSKKGIRFYSLVMVFVVWFALFQGVYHTQVEDPGVGWHLRTGEWVLTHHAVPKVDPFLATKTPLPWVSDQWLSDVILYKIYQNFSWLGLNLLPQFVFFIFLYCVLFLSVRRVVGQGLAAGIGIACVMRFPLIHYVCRPVIFSFICFSLVYSFLVEKKYLDKNQNISKWDYVKVGLIFLFWANLHPSFILGIALLCLYLISTFADWLILERKVSFSFFGKFLLLTITSVLVTLINPYFYHLHQSIFELAGSEYFMNLNMEWHALSYKNYMEKFLLLLYVLIPLAVLLRHEFFKAWGFLECGFIVIAFHFTTQHVRMLPYIAILLSYPVALSARAIMDYLYEKTPWFLSFIKRIYDDINYDEDNGRNLHWYAAVALFVVFCSWPTIFEEKEALGAPTPENCPRKAIAFLVDKVKERPLKVYATPNFGGCITHFGDGKVLAIMDDRNTMLGEKRYKDYFKGYSSTRRYKRLLRRVKADYSILDRNAEIDRKLIDDLHDIKIKEVYKDKDQMVFAVADIL